MRTSHRRRAAVAALLSCALVMGACGSDDDTSDDDSEATSASAAGPAESSAPTPASVGESSESTAATPAEPSESTATTPEESSATTAEATGPEGETVTGGELIVGYALNPSSLDPTSGGSGGDHQSLYPLYDRLINFEPETLEPLPGLATEWDFPDPQTLVLTLQEGVQFHDGTPFDAQAVKDNLDRALTLETSTVKADLSMIESVEVTAPNEVAVHLNRPDSSLLLILADRPGMMVSPTAATAAGAEFGRNPVGTGPFTFVEWLPSDRLVLKKNPDYWQDGKPYLDQITIRYLADSQTSISALTADEVDMTLGVSPADVDTVEGEGDLTVVSHSSLSFDTCYFNLSRAPFNDVNARLAVNHALDRAAMNESYVFGRAIPAHEVYPPGYWAADPALAETFTFDQDKSRELLATAGYPDGVSVKGLGYNAPGQERKMEIVQAQLAEVGIDMTFDMMEVGSATSTFFEDLTYDIYCAGWSGRPDPSQTANSMFSSTSFYNAGKYASPGMDEALKAAGASQDQAERAEAFSKIIKLSQDDALVAPLLHNPNINALHSQVGGFVPNLYGKIDLSFLWVEEE